MSANNSVRTDEPFLAGIECRLEIADDGRSFVLSVFDKASAAILGRRTLASSNGHPPQLTVADALELVGGAYRVGCVRLDLECRMIERAGARLVRRARRRKRIAGLPTPLGRAAA